VDAALDSLSDQMETHADVDGLLGIATACERKKSVAHGEML